MKTTYTPPPPNPTPQGHVVVEMTEREARAIKDILGSLYGRSETISDIHDSLYTALPYNSTRIIDLVTEGNKVKAIEKPVE